MLEEIFPVADEEALADVISEDFVNHEAPEGTPPGRGSVAFYIHMLAEAFSEQRWTVHHVVAEDDMVVLHCTHSGRHTGEIMGLPATGRSSTYQQMHMIRLKDRRGVEHWAVRDDAGLMRQLTG